MNKSTKILSATLIIIAAAIGYFIYKQSFSPKAKALQKVKSTLRDPASAKFKCVEQTGGAVHGLVNAKNAFGGYTGYKYFSIEGGKMWTGMEIKEVNMNTLNQNELKKYKKRLDRAIKKLKNCNH